MEGVAGQSIAGKDPLAGASLCDARPQRSPSVTPVRNASATTPRQRGLAGGRFDTIGVPDNDTSGLSERPELAALRLDG